MTIEGVVFGVAGEPPSRERLAEVLGAGLARWDELVRRATAMEARGGWAWNGPRYGWSWRSRRSGKSFLTLEARADGPHALVVLGRDDSERAAALPLTARMRATYDAARQFPDGRWIFQTVETDDDVEDVSRLLLLKIPPTVRRRLENTEPWAAAAPAAEAP